MARSIRRIATRPTVSDKSRVHGVVNALDAIYRGLNLLEILTITPTEANIVKEMISMYNAFTDLDSIDQVMDFIQLEDDRRRDSIDTELRRQSDAIRERIKVLKSVHVQNVAEVIAREFHAPLSHVVVFLNHINTEAKALDGGRPWTLAEIVREIADGSMGESEYDFSPGCKDAPMLRQVFSWYFESGRNVNAFKNRLLEDLTVLASDAERAAEYVHQNWNVILACLARSEWNEAKPDPFSGVKPRIGVIKAVRSIGYGDLKESMQFVTDIGIV